MKKGLKKAITIFLLLMMIVSQLQTATNVKAEDDEASTTDTFSSNGGSYTYDYIMQNIGVFSFNNVSAVHIVGPIIAKGQVYNINNTSRGIDFGNYHQGVSSYVQGGLKPYTSITPARDAIYDNSDLLGRMPVFYTGTANQNVVSDDGEVYTIDGQELLAMHHTKYWNSDLYVTGGIYGNYVEFTDNYIDWNAARDAFNKEAKLVDSSAKSVGRNITSEDLITADNNPFGGKVLVVEPGDIISIDGDTFLTQKGAGDPTEVAVDQTALNELYGEITAIIIKSDSEYFSDQIVLNVEGEGNYTIPNTYYCNTSDDPYDANNWYQGTIENWYYGYDGNTERPYINMFWNIVGDTSNPGLQEIYFPDNTDRDAVGIGNIAAPNSKIYINYGDYNGTVICDDLINRSEIHMMTSNVSIIPDTFNFKIKKVDSEDNTQLLDGAQFKLTLLDTEIEQVVTTMDGIASFYVDPNNKVGKYKLEEVVAPDGYQLLSEAVTFEVDANGDILNLQGPAILDETDGLVLIVENIAKTSKTSRTVTKIWDDNNNQDGIRPNSITVNLLANEVVIDTVTLDESNNWTYTWTNLPSEENGNVITYDMEEVGTITGYTSTNQKDANGNVTITNSHIPSVVNKSVTKVWDDNNNQDGIRPNSITVDLLADEVVIDTVTLDESNNWTYTWTNLPSEENGNVITYDMEEVGTITGYTSTNQKDANGNVTITNSHIPSVVNKSVTKVWDDNNNQDGIRPNSITVDLLANEVVIDTVTLDVSNNWTYTWTNLPSEENGNVITYDMEEVGTITGYTSTNQKDANGNVTITNSHIPSVVNKSVTKVWDDNNNQDGIRPNSITVNLLANGVVIDTVTLDESNDWTYTWTNLPSEENGNVITYDMEEVGTITGYTSINQKDANGNVTITNSHIPSVVNRSVTKVWDDNNNQDGIRPNSITVDLLANEVVIDTVTLDESNNWTYTWTELALNKEGKEIIYSVEEKEIPENYEVSYSKDGFTITNTVNSSNTEQNDVKTGDATNLEQWLILGMFSFAAAFLLLKRKKCTLK